MIHFKITQSLAGDLVIDLKLDDIPHTIIKD